MIEKQTDRQIKCLRIDNGLEFCSHEFNDFCKKEGILRHLTVPGTPQKNGVAERMNRTLMENVRCIVTPKIFRLKYDVIPEIFGFRYLRK